MKEQLYFKNEDSEGAYPLSHFIAEAKEEGLEEITLIEAIQDNYNPDYSYCKLTGEVGEKSECCEALCISYQSKSGKGKCIYRGNLCTYGEEKTFKIDRYDLYSRIC